MALKLYTEENIQNIANAIREKNKSSELYKVNEMADAIRALSTDINWEWVRPGDWPDLDQYAEVLNLQYEQFYLGTWQFEDVNAAENFVSLRLQNTSTTNCSGISVDLGYLVDGNFVSLYHEEGPSAAGTNTTFVRFYINDVVPEGSRKHCYVVRAVPTDPSKPWDKIMRLGASPSGVFERGNQVCEAIVKLPGTTVVVSQTGVYGGINLRRIKFMNMNFATMGGVFQNYVTVEQIEFVDCDFSAATTCLNMFNNCLSLKRITSNTPMIHSSVTDISYMFQSCHNLLSFDFGDCDLSSISKAAYAFAACANLRTVDNINNMNAVTDISFMFNDASSLLSIDLSQCDLHNVTTLSNTFNGCASLRELYLPLDMTECTNLYKTFFHCYSLIAIDLGMIDGSKVTSANDMCTGCSQLAHTQIPSNLSQVTVLTFTDANRLAHDTIVSIFNNLVDHSSDEGTYRVILGNFNLSKLTIAEKGIATQKKWTVT